jgi:hypothetical protein
MMEDLLTARDSFTSGHFEGKVLRGMIDDHCAGHTDHSQRLYALIMLELWWQQK